MCQSQTPNFRKTEGFSDHQREKSILQSDAPEMNGPENQIRVP